MRYGLILPADGRLAAWQQSCLAQLEAAGPGAPQWIFRNRAEPRHGALWRAFLRGSSGTTEELLAAYEPNISPKVDFVLNFSGAPPEKKETGAGATYGIWNCSFDAWAPGLWRAFLEGRESFPIALYAAGQREVLQKGAVPLAGSWPQSCEAVQKVLAGWPARHAREINLMGQARREEPAQPDLAAPPSSAKLVAQMLFHPFAKFRRRWRRLIRFDSWNVGIARLASAPRQISDLANLPSIRWLPPRRELYYFADPFPFQHQGQDFLLVEAYGHPKGVKGEICRIALAKDGGGVTAETVIVRPEHLSYPCIVQDGAFVYCVPEMHREGGCTFFRLEDDGSWKAAHRILPERKLVDPTIFRHDGCWWLFCTDAESGSNVALLAFHAASLEGPWTAHALNPLKCDAGTARPAGEIFRLDGLLYRPAQDCRQTYGGAVTLMEITALSPDSFREQPALRLEADSRWPYPDGLHHFVLRGDTVFFDAKRQKRSFLLWLRTQFPGHLT